MGLHVPARLIGPGLAVAMVLIGISLPAAASGQTWTRDGLKYQRATAAMTPTGGGFLTKQVEADCNPGNLRWRSTGGGVELPGIGSPTDARVSESGALNGLWFGSGRESAEVGGSPAVEATSICRRARRNKGQRGISLEAFGAGFRTVKVRCPSKGRWRVTGGGVNLHAAGSGYVISSHPADGPDGNSLADDAWRARVFTNSPGTPGKRLIVSALCIKRVRGQSWSRPLYRSKAVQLAQGAMGSVRVRCPRHTNVSGGGIEFDAATSSARMLGAHPFDSADSNTTPNNGFAARANYPPSGAVTPPVELIVHAVCLRKLPPRQDA